MISASARCLKLSSRLNVTPYRGLCTAYSSSFLQVHMPVTSEKIVCRSFQLKPQNVTCSVRFTSTVGSDSEHGKLLYIGTEKRRLRRTLGTFYLASAVIYAASPKLLAATSESILGTVFISFNIFAFAFLNPLLLYQLGKRHVNELHYNEKKDLYTAVTISPFVVNDKKTTFTASECQMPLTPSAFTSFYVGRKPLFINSDDMNYQEYMHMLRFASNLDFENPTRHEQYEKGREQYEKGREQYEKGRCLHDRKPSESER